MRILLDESLPLELKSELHGHDVRTVRQEGWSSLKNGELLARSVGRFDVFLTADQNLRYQHNLGTLPVAVAVIVSRSNRIEDLRPLMSRLLDALANLQPQTLVEVR
ncbi:MAG: DUF5615 family PIN-like protein [Betaproteobacteria bacterium]